MTKNYIQIIKNIFTEDPKPIFDHVRNIGIAAAIIIGAGFLNSGKLAANSAPPGFISFASIILAIGGTALFIINMIFAQNKISTLILGKHASTGILARLAITKRLFKARKRINGKKILKSIFIFYAKDSLAQLVVILYYFFIFSLVAAQALSPPGTAPQINEQAPNESFINVEKFNSSINALVEKNKNLETTIKELETQLSAKNATVLDLKKTLEEVQRAKANEIQKETHTPESKT